jgi:hypothetical protein
MREMDAAMESVAQLAAAGAIKIGASPSEVRRSLEVIWSMSGSSQ